MSNITREARIALRVWLAERERTQRWLANRIGVLESDLSKALNGHQKPSDAMVRGIRRLTGIELIQRAA